MHWEPPAWSRQICTLCLCLQCFSTCSFHLRIWLRCMPAPVAALYSAAPTTTTIFIRLRATYKRRHAHVQNTSGDRSSIRPDALFAFVGKEGKTDQLSLPNKSVIQHILATLLVAWMPSVAGRPTEAATAAASKPPKGSLRPSVRASSYTYTALSLAASRHRAAKRRLLRPFVRSFVRSSGQAGGEGKEGGKKDSAASLVSVPSPALSVSQSLSERASSEDEKELGS